jgi:hypothetical protein
MSCGYTALNFVCNGSGYLTLGLQADTDYPCPGCNTKTYLEKSYRAAEDRRKDDKTCLCCGPGLSYDAIWSTAVKTAYACNPDVTEATIELFSAAHRRPTNFRAD